MRLTKRSFSLAGHRTSVALEEAFWAALTDIATAQRRSVGALVAELDAERVPEQPLASALRVFALAYFRKA
jgi:predicted DNA-binding ribbon-helix-helix protein